MYPEKCFIQLACILALSLAFLMATSSVEARESLIVDPYLEQQTPVLVRQIRSPDGSVDLTYKDDRAGREASLNYNQNIYKSGDGRVNVDAYAHGSRNFDTNRNDYGGGIRGSIRF